MCVTNLHIPERLFEMAPCIFKRMILCLYTNTNIGFEVQISKGFSLNSID